MFEHLDMVAQMQDGYLINPMPDPLPAALRAAFAEVSVATIGHLLWDGFLDHRTIRAMQPERKILGTAVTFRLPSFDTALLHHATGLVRPGDVVVIDRAGDTRMACLGGNVALALAVAGAEGAVLDGPICDPDEIRSHGFPVWAQGVSPITTRRAGPAIGAMNIPVTCAGVTINPGDVILADESGVLALSRDKAAAIAEPAVTKEATSAKRRVELRGGAKLGALTGADERVAAHRIQGSSA